jgi:hypothetical protein
VGLRTPPSAKGIHEAVKNDLLRRKEHLAKLRQWAESLPEAGAEGDRDLLGELDSVYEDTRTDDAFGNQVAPRIPDLKDDLDAYLLRAQHLPPP